MSMVIWIKDFSKIDLKENFYHIFVSQKKKNLLKWVQHIDQIWLYCLTPGSEYIPQFPHKSRFESSNLLIIIIFYFNTIK